MELVSNIDSETTKKGLNEDKDLSEDSQLKCDKLNSFINSIRTEEKKVL